MIIMIVVVVVVDFVVVVVVVVVVVAFQPARRDIRGALASEGGLGRGDMITSQTKSLISLGL